jgi:hypothetical protein
MGPMGVNQLSVEATSIPPIFLFILFIDPQPFDTIPF